MQLGLGVVSRFSQREIITESKEIQRTRIAPTITFIYVGQGLYRLKDEGDSEVLHSWGYTPDTETCDGQPDLYLVWQDMIILAHDRGYCICYRPY